MVDPGLRRTLGNVKREYIDSLPDAEDADDDDDEDEDERGLSPKRGTTNCPDSDIHDLVEAMADVVVLMPDSRGRARTVAAATTRRRAIAPASSSAGEDDGEGAEEGYIAPASTCTDRRPRKPSAERAGQRGGIVAQKEARIACVVGLRWPTMPSA
jgi:hypothetical protein